MRNKIEQIGKQTLEKHHSLWMWNIYENYKSCGFDKTILALHEKHKDEKAIIFSAGCHKDWLNRDYLSKIYSTKNRPLVIACDHAVPLFVDNGYVPDYIVSVDGSPLIAKYFWRKLKEKPKGVILLVQTHPLTTEMITAHGYPIYWFQHHKRRQTKDLWVKGGISSLPPLGNVGTTAWNVAVSLFSCKPVGLLDIEFAWSDETAYREDDREMRAGYEKTYNPLTKSYYQTDYTYGMYLQHFKQIFKTWKKSAKKTVCLTKEGTIHSVGIQYKSLEEFLRE